MIPSPNIEALIAQCDEEIARCLVDIATDEGALIGLRDWRREKALLEAFLNSPNIETHSLTTTSAELLKTFTKDCGNLTDEQEAKG